MLQRFLEHKTVLLVEDDPLQAIEYCEWLCEAGAKVVGPFQSVSRAMLALERVNLDAAVVDFGLADKNSSSLQDALEERNIPFVVITGYPGVLVRRSQCQKVIAKPLDSDTLCVSVRRLCNP